MPSLADVVAANARELAAQKAAQAQTAANFNFYAAMDNFAVTPAAPNYTGYLDIVYTPVNSAAPPPFVMPLWGFDTSGAFSGPTVAISGNRVIFTFFVWNIGTAVLQAFVSSDTAGELSYDWRAS